MLEWLIGFAKGLAFGAFAGFVVTTVYYWAFVDPEEAHK